LFNIVKIEEQDSVSSIQGSRYTLVRPLHNASYPSDIEAAVDKEKNENNHHINTAISEYELLQALLGTYTYKHFIVLC
jgi:hypothetical protein